MKTKWTLNMNQSLILTFSTVKNKNSSADQIIDQY